eukprot:scaffold20120_cov133-Cylindrotheca_fusiformis.AAC.2
MSVSSAMMGVKRVEHCTKFPYFRMCEKKSILQASIQRQGQPGMQPTEESKAVPTHVSFGE